MKLYIASFFDTRQRLRPYAEQLWHKGHEIVSSWLNETAKPAHMSKDEFWKKLAIKDLAEIKQADLLIIDTVDITPRGGREVELGFALAHFQTKSTWLVGPVRNVFHELVDRRFDSWEDVVEALPDIAEKPTSSSPATEIPTTKMEVPF